MGSTDHGSPGAPKHLIDIYDGQLTPDVLIVRRRQAKLQENLSNLFDQVETFVVDQKRYSGLGDRGAISHGSAAANAGKYLWALRRRGSPGESGVDHVALISPGGGGMYVDEARTSVVAARPEQTDGLATLADRLID